MCTICFATSTFDPSRHTGISPIIADGLDQFIPEITDAAGDASTTISFGMGDAVVAELGVSGDVDWYEVSLEAGVTYTFAAFGSEDGMGTLADSDLTLYDSGSTQIAYDDYSGTGVAPQLTFTATTSGTYYIAVDAYNDTNTGTYLVGAISHNESAAHDAAAGTSTHYGTAVGQTFTGEISTSGDVDWISVTLEAGKTYNLLVLGSHSSGGTLLDADLFLYDASGNQLDYNDASGAGYDPLIKFTATTTGTYYLGVDQWNHVNGFTGKTGTYTLSVTEAAPATEGTLDELAYQLTDGFWGNQQFTWGTNNDGSPTVITVNIDDLTADGQQLALWAMDAWEMVANIDFQVVTGVTANINCDDDQSGAYAYQPGAGGGELNVSLAWVAYYGETINSYAFQTYIHEFGHAIGLGHQGNYNGSATYGVDNMFTNDSWQMSIMSYFSQSDNTDVNATYAALTSTMMADVLAIQNLYGAAGASSATAGNTTWGNNSNLGNYLDTVMDYVVNGTTTANLTGGTLAFTIFDQGGYDVIDLSPMSTNNRLDMNAGTFSDLGSLTGVLAISSTSHIESALLGSGDDTITGNDLNNRIDGGAGNDSLMGGAGNDTLIGGIGDDTLLGGAGSDVMFGGEGSDTYYIEAQNGQDVIVEYDNSGNSGNVDRLVLSDVATMFDLYGISRAAVNGSFWEGSLLFELQDGHSVLLKHHFASDGYRVVEQVEFGDGSVFNLSNQKTGSTGNDIIVGGSATDYLAGHGGNDLLIGGGGNDVLNGHAGDDTLLGGAGNDLLRGGTGGDIYIIRENDGVDRVVDFDGVSDLASFDTIVLDDISSFLDLSISRIALGGSSWEGSLYFDLSGGNSLTVDHHFAGSGDYMIEALVLGDGTTFALSNQKTGSAGHDVLVGGSTVDNLVGLDGHDFLTANGGDDVIFGNAGNDTLSGGAGDDTLIGGTGADVYVYHGGDGADKIRDFDGVADLTSADLLVIDNENLNPVNVTISRVAIGGSSWEGSLMIDMGNGDSITIAHQFDGSGNYSIEGVSFGGDNILTLASHTTGSSLDDLVVGTSDVNYVQGFEGDDILVAGGGDDFVRGHAGDDTIFGGAGDDMLRGGDGADAYVFHTGDGADMINDFDGVSDTSSVDTIIFADVTDIGDLSFSQVAVGGSSWLGSLLIEYGSDSVQILHHFAGSGDYEVEQIMLADGSTYLINDLLTA